MVSLKGSEVGLALFAFLAFAAWSSLNVVYSQIPNEYEMVGNVVGGITGGFFWAWFVPLVVLIVLAILYFAKR